MLLLSSELRNSFRLEVQVDPSIALRHHHVQLVLSGSLIKLNEKNWPGCYLARSPPADVARVESRTYICSESAWGIIVYLSALMRFVWPPPNTNDDSNS